MDNKISPAELKKLLTYNPETGKLFWRPRDSKYFISEAYCRSWNTRFAGKPAFNAPKSGGYLSGSVLGIKHEAHRIAWAIHYGKWPQDQIDHENHDRMDNRILNLVQATPSQNAKNRSRSKNNKSGFSGVVWSKKSQKWCARIGGIPKKNLGYYNCFALAVKARKAAEDVGGYHQNHGV